jgi:hypothetical protein
MAVSKGAVVPEAFVLETLSTARTKAVLVERVAS